MPQVEQIIPADQTMGYLINVVRNNKRFKQLTDPADTVYAEVLAEWCERLFSVGVYPIPFLRLLFPTIRWSNTAPTDDSRAVLVELGCSFATIYGIETAETWLPVVVCKSTNFYERHPELFNYMHINNLSRNVEVGVVVTERNMEAGVRHIYIDDPAFPVFKVVVMPR